MKILIRCVAGLGAWLLATAVIQAGGLQKMVVCVPVADVRNEIKAAPAGLRGPALFKKMKGQLSQVLMGECILAEPDRPGWLRVELLEQKNWHKNKFSSMVGYIQDHQAVPVESFPTCTSVVRSLWAPVVYKNKKLFLLSCGTKLKARRVSDEWCKVILPVGKVGLMRLSDISFVQPALVGSSEQLRESVVDLAKQFLGSPYVWGGRSAYALAKNNQITSIDCSGLVNVVFQSVGLQVPRNSVSQFKTSKSVLHGKDLKPGDLIFFGSSEDPVASIAHVGIYAGNDTFIEATGRDKSLSTRISTLQDVAGESLTNLKNGQQCVGGSRRNEYIFFGSMLADQVLAQQMHNDWLGRD
ncbi:C40 family peptidase [bacterium]|nr:MAG: C40 family peptidase [bacterium]